MSTPFKKLTEEEKDRVLGDVKTILEQGLADSPLVFTPEGFELPITYSRNEADSSPIPDFRPYAQQLLALLAITSWGKSMLFSAWPSRLECRIEVEKEELQLVLIIEGQISSTMTSSGVAPATEVIGSAFSSAALVLFPNITEIFWDKQLASGHLKFWLKYPGRMTIEGFQKTIRSLPFGWTARVEIAQPSEENQRRSAAVLDFILNHPNPEA